MTERPKTQRVRIRGLTAVRARGEQYKPVSRYWAWSRPHVAEEIGRHEDNVKFRGKSWGWPREIHLHPVGAPNTPPSYEQCDETCLLVDCVDEDLPKDEAEKDREKIG